MIVQPTESNLQRAADELLAGKCIGLPTETVYGLAANGFDEKALALIFSLKNRPLFDPLILHVHPDYPIENLAKNIPSYVEELKKKFWPGPLTFLLEKKEIVPHLATAGEPTVAIRCPQHPIALDLLKRLNFPLAAPSANQFGRISPTCAEDVAKDFKEDLLIFDGGRCKFGIESTIIDCRNELPRLIRSGALSIEEISRVTGGLDLRSKNILSEIKAPGILKHHYAPRTPLYLSPDSLLNLPRYSNEEGYLFWNQAPRVPPKHYRVLTSFDSDIEAASHLFRFLRELDQSTIKTIYCDPIPPQGLGRAIQDRLVKASHGMAKWNKDQWSYELRD
jgi:L-threonylcarbamoyladenylate synthase